MSSITGLKRHHGSRSWGWARPRADLSTLPATIDLSVRTWHVLVVVGFGAIWTAFSWQLVEEVASSPPAVMAFALLFPAVGVVIMAGGLLMLLKRRKVTFDRIGVTVESVGLLGRRAWSLPYSAYQGVLLREVVSRGENSTTIYQIIELHHAERDKTLPIFVATTGDVPRAQWEEYARILKLPALEEHAGALVARDPKDLDKSLKELVRERKVTTSYRTETAPPRGLTVSRDSVGGDHALKVVITAGRFPWWMAALFFGFPSIIMVVGLTQSDVWPMALFAAGFMALAAVIFVKDRNSPREIMISREDLTFTDALRQHGPKSQSMKLAEIENIATKRARSNMGDELVVAGDHGSIELGTGLSKEARNWLRDYLTAAIANA